MFNSKNGMHRNPFHWNQECPIPHGSLFRTKTAEEQTSKEMLQTLAKLGKRLPPALAPAYREITSLGKYPEDPDIMIRQNTRGLFVVDHCVRKGRYNQEIFWYKVLYDTTAVWVPASVLVLEFRNESKKGHQA